jgi:hypothetical protein
MLHTLAEMVRTVHARVRRWLSSARARAQSLLPPMSTKDETFNNFLWEMASDAMEREQRLGTVKKRLIMVQAAAKAIQQHHAYLQERCVPAARPPALLCRR